MKKDMEIVRLIQAGNTQKKEFFLQKLKTELQAQHYQVADNILETLFMEAVHSYSEDCPSRFYYYAMHQMKNHLQDQEQNGIPSNTLFSRQEMIILQTYLQKTDDHYLSVEEVAKKLSLPISLVNQTVMKLHIEYGTNHQEVVKSFPTISFILSERRSKEFQQKIEKKPKKISQQDIQLLGYFTGQINDICLDIDELAKRDGTSPGVIKEQLRFIYTLLKEENNLKLVKQQYPDIKDMLIIRAKILGITQTSYLSEAPQKRQKRHKANSHSSSASTREKNIPLCVKFLKVLYQKKEDGTYYRPSEGATLLGIECHSFYVQKSRLLKDLKTKPQFLQLILQQYPTLLNDQAEYDQFKEDVKLLKAILQKQKGGNYRSNEEIAVSMNLAYEDFIDKKKKLFERLTQDTSYKNAILKRCGLAEILEIVPTQDIQSSSQPQTITAYDIELFQKIFTKKEDGTFPSNKEVADAMGLTYQDLLQKKKEMFISFDHDLSYRKAILKECPDIFKALGLEPNSDLEQLPSLETLLKQAIQLAKDIKLLQKSFIKKDDGTFPSNQEVAEAMGLKYATFMDRRKDIFTRFDQEASYRKAILKECPDILKDLYLGPNPDLEQLPSLKSLFQQTIQLDKDVELAQKIYAEKEDGTHYSNQEVADAMGLKYQAFINRKMKMLSRLARDLFYKEAVLKRCGLKEFPEIVPKRDIQSASQPKTTIDYDIELFQKIFTKKEHGTFPSNKEVAKAMGLTDSTFVRRRKIAFGSFDHDPSYRKAILKEYPDILKDLYLGPNPDLEQLPSLESLLQQTIQLDKDVELAQKIYAEKEDGTHYSNQEVASSMGLKYQNFMKKKGKMLSRLYQDPFYKEAILKRCELEGISVIVLVQDLQSFSQSKITADYDIELFQKVFTKKKDGTYPSNQEVAEAMGLPYSTFVRKRRSVFDRFDQELSYRKVILEKCPDILKDLYLGPNPDLEQLPSLESLLQQTIRLDQDVELFQKIFTKKDDGTYPSNKEVAKVMDLIDSTFVRKRTIAFDRFDQDSSYRKAILEKYPDIFKDLYLGPNPDLEQLPSLESLLRQTIRLDQDVGLVQKIYTKKDDGTYRSGQEVADAMGLKYTTFMNRKKKIFTRFDQETSYRKAILEKCPALLMALDLGPNPDLEQLPSLESLLQQTIQLDQDVELVQKIYTKKDDGTYYSNQEVADAMGLKYATFMNRKMKMLSRLDRDLFYKEAVLKRCELEGISVIVPAQDIQSSSQPKTTIDYDIELFQKIFTKKEHGTFPSNKEVADAMGLKYQDLLQKKKEMFISFDHDLSYRKAILKECPDIFKALGLEPNSDLEQLPSLETLLKQAIQLTKDIKLLQKSFIKKDDGTFPSNQEVAEAMGLKYATFMDRRKDIFTRFDQETSYRKAILKECPDILKDLYLGPNPDLEQLPSLKSLLQQTIQLDKDVELAQKIYAEKEDGTHYSNQEVADAMGLKYQAFINRKMKMLSRLDRDLSYKEAVLKRCELEGISVIVLAQDIQSSSQPKTTIDYGIELLQKIFTKEDAGPYLSNQEVADAMGLKYATFMNRRKKIFARFDQEPSYRKAILEKCPALLMALDLGPNPDLKQLPSLEQILQLDEDIKLLRAILQREKDGSFRSSSIIASSQYLSLISFLKKKKRIFEQFDQDLSYRNAILVRYPEFLNLLYIDAEQDVQSLPSLGVLFQEANCLGKDIKLLQEILTKKKDGTYPSNQEVAEAMGLKYQTFIKRKDNMFSRLYQDPFYKEAILKWGGLEEISEFVLAQDLQSASQPQIITAYDIELFQKIFTKRKDGTYRSGQEVADAMYICYTLFLTKKKRIFAKFNQDAAYREAILNQCPELRELLYIHTDDNHDLQQQQLPDLESLLKQDIQLRKDVRLLKQIYQRQADGSYRSNVMVAASMGLQYPYFISNKNKLFRKLEQNPSYCKKILKLYPEFLEEKELYAANCQAFLSESEKQVLDILYSDTTKQILPDHELADRIHFSPQAFSLLSGTAIAKVKNNPNLVKKYPRLDTQVAIRAHYQDSNSISIPETELSQIRKRSQLLEHPHVAAPNTEDRLLQGINALENSCFHDYIDLCTMEQKAMLALRLGFFNQTSFSTSDVAKMFGTEEDVVIQLTNDCVRSVPAAQEKKVFEKSKS